MTAGGVTAKIIAAKPFHWMSLTSVEVINGIIQKSLENNFLAASAGFIVILLGLGVAAYWLSMAFVNYAKAIKTLRSSDNSDTDGQED